MEVLLAISCQCLRYTYRFKLGGLRHVLKVHLWLNYNSWSASDKGLVKDPDDHSQEQRRGRVIFGRQMWVRRFGH